MALATISSGQFGLNWPSQWGTSGTLKIIVSNMTFVFGTKTYVQGRISDPVNQRWCVQSAITVAGNVGTFASFQLPQTDAEGITVINGSGSPRYAGIYYDSKGVKRGILFQDWHLSSSLTTSFSFEAWAVDNSAQGIVNPRPVYLDSSGVQNAITARLNGPASTTSLGIIKTDVTPTDTSSPVAVVSNSPRVAQKAIVATGVEATDTANLQAAITALGVSGGVIRTLSSLSAPLKINGTSITFPSLTNALTFEVYGYWDLSVSNHTLTLPNNVNWIGLGGAQNLQFQNAGPTAGIIPPAGNIPTLQILGSNSHLIKNLAINQPTGMGILVGGTAALSALTTLENVAVSSSNVSTSIPLVLDSTFWFWAKHCVFLSATNSPHSIKVTGTWASVPTSYLLFFEDMVTSGRGVYFGSGVSNSGGFGNIVFRNWVYENALEAAIKFDNTNHTDSLSGLVDLLLDTVSTADSISLPAFITKTGSGAGIIKNVTVLNADITSAFTTAQIENLLFLTGRGYPYTSGWSIGNQKTYTVQRDGKIDAEDINRAGSFAPALQPFTSYAVNQDASAWSGLPGGATVTTGIIAPDGQATAGKLTAASLNNRRVFTTTTTLSVGDYIVFGVWLRSEDATVPPYKNSLIGTNGGGVVFDGGNSYTAISDEMADQYGAQRWVYTSKVAKVTAVSGSCDLNFDLGVDATHPTSYWRPFAFRIPASAGWTEADVYRLKRQITNIVASAPAASIALFSDQKLYFGGGTFATKALSPAQITANQNNYDPGGLSYFIRLTSDASRNLTGLTTSQIDGEAHVIVNVGSQNLVLVNESASSTAANRFTNSTGADITLAGKQAADVVYDSATSRWLVWKRN